MFFVYKNKRKIEEKENRQMLLKSLYNVLFLYFILSRTERAEPIGHVTIC